MSKKSNVTYIQSSVELYKYNGEPLKKIMEREYHASDNLQEVILDDSIEIIEADAFSDCKNLKRIVLPKNLGFIGRDAFSGCTSLEEIVFPESVERIDSRILADCTKLKKVVLPKNVSRIKDSIFSGCKRLVDVTFPENIDYLPDTFFIGCENLDITLPKHITTLGQGVFEGCSKLRTFPEHIMGFGDECFKNCYSLDNVYLNKSITEIPEAAFCNCSSLSNIASDNKKVTIKKWAFKGCSSLREIPSFVKSFNSFAFENCTGLTKVKLISSSIPEGCFKGCSNLVDVQRGEKITTINYEAFSGCSSLKKVNFPNLKYTGANVFAECSSLEDVTLGNQMDLITRGLFLNCKSLKHINLPVMASAIQNNAFKGCSNLEEIEIPENVLEIGRDVLANCDKIKSLHIPANVEKIMGMSFRDMHGLETITVSKENKRFKSPDGKILISTIGGSIVLYAIGSKDEKYSLIDSIVTTTNDGNELIDPINGILPWAFKDAKNLKELTIGSCVSEFDCSSFAGCENLKKLVITGVPLYSYVQFKVSKPLGDGRYELPFDLSGYDSPIQFELPFKELDINGSVRGIKGYGFDNVNSLEKLTFNTDEDVELFDRSFYSCDKLKEVHIPKNVTRIDEHTFSKKTSLKFSNGLEFKSGVKLSLNNSYRDRYKLYSYLGSFVIEDGDTLYKTDYEKLEELLENSHLVANNPVLIYDYLKDLKTHGLNDERFHNGILVLMSLKNRDILFENSDLIDDYFFEILESSHILDSHQNESLTGLILHDQGFENLFKYIKIFKKYNITEPELRDKFFISLVDPDVYERLINFNKDLFYKIVKHSSISHIPIDELPNPQMIASYNVSDKTKRRVDSLEEFVHLMDKYNITDSYLYNQEFISFAGNSLFVELVKSYDSNTKRLIKHSLTITNSSSDEQNFEDLLKFMKMLGCFEDDPVVKQKALTFITEKIFADQIPVKKSDDNPSGFIHNEYAIIGDDIHRVFNLPDNSIPYKPNFAEFFMNNYKKVISYEKRSKSGFIERVYRNFGRIEETCTSDRGDQRRLKVTINKCINYLAEYKFRHSTKETEKISKIVGEWFDNDVYFDNAVIVCKEAQSAPRNIFAKETLDKDNNVIYDMDPKNDLKEKPGKDKNGFTYEWLPKQDLRNLVLGKYCGCCAHIGGAGQGIMRASMILDCCQNLAIKDGNGNIVGKATIYVNKSMGYAVYNNVESSLSYRGGTVLEEIYHAFLRGTDAFVETFNKNHKDNPITTVTIGSDRNTIKEYLVDHNGHPDVPIKQALYFGKYSLSGYGWQGDWTVSQRQVLPNTRVRK